MKEKQQLSVLDHVFFFHCTNDELKNHGLIIQNKHTNKKPPAIIFRMLHRYESQNTWDVYSN